MKVFLGEDRSCGLNYYYYQVHNYFRDYLVKDIKDADIILVPSTCSCTHTMMEDTLGYIAYLQQQNPDAKIYVSGCLVRTMKNDCYKEFLDEFMSKRNIKIYPVFEIGKMFEEILQENYDTRADHFGYCIANKEHAILFISNGCMNNCSFCKINFQEMPLKSMDLDGIKHVIDLMDEEGISDLAIKGTNISQYGYDLYKKFLLPEVIEYAESKNSIKKIDLIGFAYKDAIENDFKYVLKNSKKLDMIDGSLESGSNRLLKLIKKGFTREEFLSFIDGLEDKYLSLAIIAGFPTETIDDIRETLDVLNHIRRGRVQICRYIDSPFVASHKLEQFSDELINEHARIYQRTLNKRHIKNEVIGYLG